MHHICDLKKCTGCAACMNICGNKAIRMEEVEPLGFIYPIIDSDKCVDCGLCAKICPANSPLMLNAPIKAFSAISKDREDLSTSASGGASSVLSQVIIRRGGIVYGCIQRNYRDIAHRRIDSYENLYLLKGSKYVQSNIGYIYRNVKNDLNEGKEVLFIGTSCQIAGLKSFLRKDYKQLYLVDLVCHGVSSQKLLREDVDSLLKDYPNVDRKRINIEFRHKKRQQQEHFDINWNRFISYGVFIKDETRIITPQNKKQRFLIDNYITAFMAGLILRDNCYTCPYSQYKRVGDITIADFWGLKGKLIPTNGGISLLMPSTKKGLELIRDCKSFIHYEERPIEEAINGNGRLISPTPKPKERGFFIKMYPLNPHKAYKISLSRYKRDYHNRFVVPKIYAMYERRIGSNTILKVLDKIPKFRGLILNCAYAYARINNIIPE